MSLSNGTADRLVAIFHGISISWPSTLVEQVISSASLSTSVWIYKWAFNIVFGTATWQVRIASHWSSITRTDAHSQWHSRLTASFSPDTGYRGPGFESREIIGWSRWWAYRTRTHFWRYRRGGFSSSRFFPILTATQRLPGDSYIHCAIAKCQQLANSNL